MSGAARRDVVSRNNNNNNNNRASAQQSQATTTTTTTLATYLLNLIDSDQRWEDFQREVLKPFRIVASAPSTGDVKYRAFPIESRSTLSDYDLSSIRYGSSSAIEILSLIFHVNSLRLDPPDVLPVKNDFLGSHYFARYLSIVKPQVDSVGVEGDARKSLVRFWDKFYVYFSPKSTPVITVSPDDSKFYDWKSHDSNDVPWSQRYTPLQYYEWRVPGSRLNDLDTLLDENTIYKFSWLQDYLSRMRNYRERINDLASALKERDDLTRRYENLREKFVKKNTAITDTLKRSLARRENQNPISRRQLELQRRFLRNVSSLYEQYLRGVREDERRLNLLTRRRILQARRGAAARVNPQQRRFVAQQQ